MKLLLFVFLSFAPLFSSGAKAVQPAENQQLTSGMVSESGLIELSGMPGWKYLPGDDLRWADPEFDDTDWHNLKPGALRADAMPDSLWKGYGWWRFSLQADSTLSEQLSNFNFVGWGAAEIFLDGQKVASYGEFSTDAGSEKTYTPFIRVNNPMRSIAISPGETHLIAVRYSNHQAKRNQQLFRRNARDLGFSFGFADINFRDSAGYNYTLWLSGSVLCQALLLFLALSHMMLFLRFRQDKSNALISLVIFSLFMSAFGVQSVVYFDSSGLWIVVLRFFLFSFFAQMALCLFPFTVSQMFKLDQYYWTKHLVWLPLIMTTYLFFSGDESDESLILSVFGISILAVFGIILVEAVRRKIYGVKYVLAGATVSVIFGLISALSVLFGYSPPMHIIGNGFYMSLPIGLYLYMSNRYGELYTSLEKEVKERTKELNDSLQNLKATQTQLVQQEKLASLGQLTAGIAHEIKNPLNFVNNFSEVSMEMMGEIKEERAKSLEARDETLVDEILDDIQSNLEKIHEHGTRANSIVSSMLQHSRGGSGKMEPTDLNALIKEYVNLSFHGMRAGRNPIDVEIELKLDSEIKEVPLIKEDFTRVIINLCNNAFDAMRTKTLQGFETLGGLDDYHPKITVRTNTEKDRILISVKDNGPGIPDEIKDKILQPFFTTKKGTEGTGLGLSITHDIIKAHGGSISISSDSNGSIFTIIIPQNS